MSEIILDTKDDRTEIVGILRRIPPVVATRWVEWQCQKVAVAGRISPRVTQDTYKLAELANRDDSARDRLTVDLYNDFWMLHLQYGLDVAQAVKDLEIIARHHLRVNGG